MKTKVTLDEAAEKLGPVHGATLKAMFETLEREYADKTVTSVELSKIHRNQGCAILCRKLANAFDRIDNGSDS